MSNNQQPVKKTLKFNPTASSYTPTNFKPSAPSFTPTNVMIQKKEEPKKEEPKEEPVQNDKEDVVEKKETKQPPKETKKEKEEKEDKPVDTSVELEKRKKKMNECEQFKMSKPHVNIMFIGHVDAGKSTISGNILYLTNMVDERMIEKFKREAIQKGRDSWFLAYIMDSFDEEKEKGKTVEVGRAHFETEKKRYTLLDAPGHQAYVPNMIMAAAQADAGILVISARQQEFEKGFDRGGQTREHVLIAKTLNVGRLLVLVNKMDEPTVQWSEDRFNEIKKILDNFLKKTGFKNVQFIPISGLSGDNLVKPPVNEKASWYKGPTFLQALDEVEVVDKDPTGILRIPVIDRYKDSGKVVVMGKIESGILRKGDELYLSPTKEKVKIESIEFDFSEKPIECAFPGENVYINVKGVDVNNISPGYILSELSFPAPSVKVFRASVMITNVRDTNPLFCAGSTAVMHLHTLTCEVIFKKIIAEIGQDRKPKKNKNGKVEKITFVKKGSNALIDFEVDQRISCESYKEFKNLATFTLRDEGLTLAIGKVTKIID
eukprot:TRINITY_DN3574_c0_g1_i2.p1 TRINITY_DN3574_c0_g1~~TRINITY_DN3574_c0_g1_i2.p1  ORF type:complete len:546 (+),score=189.89 TRINITY_DN3574_c0_g1_i2:31-1668(+)